MKVLVTISKNVQKNLHKIPKHILILFDYWVEEIETEGFISMQKINGYRDHALIGNRKGQRSSYLTKSWRVIYKVNKNDDFFEVKVLEVNHHEY